MKFKLFILILLIVFLVGCQSPTGQVIKGPICNKPYILVGNDCCLDKNDNSICDSDESKEYTEKESEQICNKPYIQVGTTCCLDKDDNGICDKDETTQEVAGEETKTLTIEDLQADMGNVIGKVVVLTKDPKLDYAQIYSNKVSNSKFLGKYGQNPYSKLTTKKREKVVQITDEKHYLKDKEDFKNFVTENKNLFIELALKSKEMFENEFKGELPKIIYLKKTNNKELRAAEKAKYVSHSELSSVLFYDNTTFLETASGNIAEIDYARVNKYELNILSDSKYTEELSNINYGQSIVVQCSPNLVIGLSFEDYGDGSTAKYERDYDRSDVTSSFFLTPLRDHYQQLIRDAQALVKMCEQRYQFTYQRWR